MENMLSKDGREKEYMVRQRRALHRRPEPSLHEYETAALIEAELDALRIANRRVGETGVLGVIGSGEKTIVLRADTDALMIEDEKDEPYRSTVNGVMHACGHDAHTAALLGAAKMLAANRSLLSGEVRLFFQQAEEIGHGARVFIEEGLLENAGRVFGLHMAPDMPVGKIAMRPGPINASVDHFSITVRGKAAHVSAPHLGVDALHIAAQIVTGLQAVVTRRTNPVDTVIIGVGTFNSGTAYNIVAETAVLEGTIRVFCPHLREQVSRQVAELSVLTAKAYGGTAELVWTDFTSPLINDAEVSREVSNVIHSLRGGDSLITDRAPALIGDDFAEYLLITPGAYAIVGSGNSERPNTVSPLHSGTFDIDEDALVVAAELYAEYAVRWLNGTIN